MMDGLLRKAARRTCCGALSLFVLAAGAGSWAQAEEQPLRLRMEGYAEGISLAARNAAIENAKEEILRQLLNNLIISGDLAHLRPLLRNSSKYFRGRPEMLRHDFIGDATRVEIDAYVDLRQLHEDVARTMLPHLPEPPELLVILGEKLAHDEIIAVPDFGYAETALREGLEQAGLRVKGVDTVSGVYRQADLIAAVTGDHERAGEFARGNMSDVVIIGTAVVELEETSPGSNVLRHRATVTLRLYRGGDGELLDTFTRIAAVGSAGAVEGSTQAVEDACAKLVNDVTIASALSVLATRRDGRVLLTVENPEIEARVQALQALLQHAFGPQSVEVLLSSGQLARLRINYDGPMIDFVDFITTNEIEGAWVEIQRAVGREVEAAFVPAVE